MKVCSGTASWLVLGPSIPPVLPTLAWNCAQLMHTHLGPKHSKAVIVSLHIVEGWYLPAMPSSYWELMEPEEKNVWRSSWSILLCEVWEVWKDRDGRKTLWRVSHMTSGWQQWQTAEERSYTWDMPDRDRKFFLKNLYKQNHVHVKKPRRAG